MLYVSGSKVGNLYEMKSRRYFDELVKVICDVVWIEIFNLFFAVYTYTYIGDSESVYIYWLNILSRFST